MDPDTTFDPIVVIAAAPLIAFEPVECDAVQLQELERIAVIETPGIGEAHVQGPAGSADPI